MTSMQAYKAIQYQLLLTNLAGTVDQTLDQHLFPSYLKSQRLQRA